MTGLIPHPEELAWQASPDDALHRLEKDEAEKWTPRPHGSRRAARSQVYAGCVDLPARSSDHEELMTQWCQPAGANLSSVTSHKPWRRPRPSAWPARCRSGAQL